MALVGRWTLDGTCINLVGAVTLTLPDATYGARELTIRRKAGTASITVTPYGTQKINGASSLTISDDLATPLQSDWSNWWTLR